MSGGDAVSGPVPVNILTGFLGVGKTTLLSRILKGNHGLKIAVVQNEFSEEMGIESPVMLDEHGNQIPDLYELPNGCVCCAMKDDFISTLERVVALRTDAAGNRKSIDRIVIEASGIADLEELIDIFWLDSGLESDIQLDSIVAIASAAHAAQFLGLMPAAVVEESSRVVENDKAQLQRLILRQIVYGDVIVLNKTDELDGVAASGGGASSAALREAILVKARELNPTARFMHCTYCDVDINAIFNINAYMSSSSHLERKPLHKLSGGPPTDALSVTHFGAEDSRQSLCAREAVSTHHLHKHDRAGGSASGHSGAVGGLCSVFVKFTHSSTDAPLSAAAFRLWIANLLWNTPAVDAQTDNGVSTNRRREFLRMKGLVWAVADYAEDYEAPPPQQPPIAHSSCSRWGDRECYWHVLQAVGHNFEFYKVTDAATHKSIECNVSSRAQGVVEGRWERTSKLLFVGFGLNRDQIQSEVLKLRCTA